MANVRGVFGLLLAAGLLGLPAAAVARTHTPLGLLGTDWAAADVDGDKLPDLVSARNTGYRHGEFAYRLHFGLSSADAGGDIDIRTRSLGLRLVLRDIDGDRDADLIVTTGSEEPVGIWLNDGRGRYTPADWRQYPDSIWHQSERSLRNAGCRTAEPPPVQESTIQTCTAPDSPAVHSPAASSGVERLSMFAAVSLHTGPCSPRAPPTA